MAIPIEPHFQNGGMKELGQNRGMRLANYFLQTNLLIGPLQNLPLLNWTSTSTLIMQLSKGPHLPKMQAKVGVS